MVVHKLFCLLIYAEKYTTGKARPKPHPHFDLIAALEYAAPAKTAVESSINRANMKLVLIFVI